MKQQGCIAAPAEEKEEALSGNDQDHEIVSEHSQASHQPEQSPHHKRTMAEPGSRSRSAQGSPNRLDKGESPGRSKSVKVDCEDEGR